METLRTLQIKATVNFIVWSRSDIKTDDTQPRDPGQFGDCNVIVSTTNRVPNTTPKDVYQVYFLERESTVRLMLI